MICQVCGRNKAVVHLEEMRDGDRVHSWLCEDCAAARQGDDFEAGDSSDPPDFLGGEGPDRGEDPAFSSFLGQMFESKTNSGQEHLSCPACGFAMKQLGKTSRLGCATCYETFRSTLVPLLVRLHRHSSHLGKVPFEAGGSLSRQGEIARYRVALEKAIAAENYEEAARLRDLISRAGEGAE